MKWAFGLNSLTFVWMNKQQTYHDRHSFKWKNINFLEFSLFSFTCSNTFFCLLYYDFPQKVVEGVVKERKEKLVQFSSMFHLFIKVSPWLNMNKCNLSFPSSKCLISCLSNGKIVQVGKLLKTYIMWCWVSLRKQCWLQAFC